MQNNELQANPEENDKAKDEKTLASTLLNEIEKKESREEKEEILLSAITAVTRRVSIERYWHGPLPPASEIKKYEDIYPGAAEKIFNMAEKQNNHRISIEKEMIKADNQKRSLGQYLGTFLGFFGLITVCFTAYIGQPWVASTLAVTTMGSILGAHLFTREKKEKEIEEKRRSETE